MEYQVNQEIKANEVRVIGEDGAQLGIMKRLDALLTAQERNLDLVNVSPATVPPVCRILDYDKFRYEVQKREKEARKNQKVIETKEIRLTPTIDEHDFQTKLRSVVKFLNDGNKVKATIRFRGREITHSDIGKKLLKRLADGIRDIGKVERDMSFEGKNLFMIIGAK